jgi:isopentenyldiphosphate isomerase
MVIQKVVAPQVGPGQWDLSVAEHLGVGESYGSAVVRGLEEELGIKVERHELLVRRRLSWWEGKNRERQCQLTYFTS